VPARNQHPGLMGFATSCEGLAMYMMGQWRAARRSIESGMNAMIEHGVGLRWESNLAEQYLTSTLFYLGETRELARLVPLLLREAVERGDVYAQHGLRGWRANLAWLVMGKPEDARAHALAVASEQPSVEAFHLHHYYELQTQMHIDLYLGDVEGAWTRIEGGWKLLGLATWSAARRLPPGEWSPPLEQVGRWVRLRLDARSAPADVLEERLSVSAIEFPFVEVDQLRDEVERNIDEARLTVLDPAWEEVIPEAWKHRMHASKP